MKILVIGSGGREHALAWKLSQSPRVSEVHCAPGNPGTALFGQNHAFSSMQALVQIAVKYAFDFVVIGPEEPLVEGLTNLLQAQGIPTFGPTKEAARLEGSKVFAKQLMAQYQIPTPQTRIFNRASDAKDYLKRDMFPVVLKLDGLAGGKGTFLCEDILHTRKLIDQILEKNKYGSAGNQILIEEMLQGFEVSLMALVSGNTIAPLLPVTDYKRAFDQNQGSNTGGMGAIAPSPWVNPSLLKRIEKEVLVPIVHGMRTEGCPFQGLLYVGLIVSKRGPKVLEFNVRFGDPETQALLPLLRSDLFSHLYAVTQGTLDQEVIEWHSGSCVNVVLASAGYPENPQVGVALSSLPDLPPNHYLFQAGTRQHQQQLSTSAGRVLSVSAQGESPEKARESVYQTVEKIQFEGKHYRRDIGLNVFSP
jgi:phosphoribosylamine--glycine ligase